MRLTENMRLIGSSRLINGCKIILGGTSAITGTILQARQSEECILESVIRGHHIYKRIWRPLVGEVLTLEREEGNTHDRFAVSLLKDAIVVGHVPLEFSRVF